MADPNLVWLECRPARRFASTNLLILAFGLVIFLLMITVLLASASGGVTIRAVGILGAAGGVVALLIAFRHVQSLVPNAVGADSANVWFRFRTGRVISIPWDTIQEVAIEPSRRSSEAGASILFVKEVPLPNLILVGDAAKTLLELFETHRRSSAMV